MADETLQRPRDQWWMRLRPVARMMAHLLPQTPPILVEESPVPLTQNGR
jgi:hypothetical protein